MTALGTTFLLGANDARAQTQRFRATPLVKLNFTPNPNLHGTAGVNEKGQVVYGYNSGGSIKPWIWLPQTDSSYVTAYEAAGFHELSMVDIATPAIARDLNESGDIVGQGNGFGPVTNSYGTLWRLKDAVADPDPTTIGNFGGANPWSSAHAVSDHSTPKIAGESADIDDCSCGMALLNQPVVHGFRMDIGSSLVELSSGTEKFSYARDIVQASGSSNFLIAGFGQCKYSNGMRCEYAASQCDTGMEPKFWNNSSTAVTLEALTTNDAEAHGVNIHGESVGFSFNTGLGCKRRAVYWATPSSSPDDLGGVMPSGQTNDGSRAAAINNLANPQVVGWNETVSHALLWEYSGSAWSVLDLQSTTAIGALGGSQPKFDLRQAHDINDSGWIITWGYCTFGPSDPLDGFYAVLLTPFSPTPNCPADINGDGSVNVPDLLAVINAWGTCPIATFCPSDVSGDFQVGVADLLAVIANWGPCGQPSDGAPESVEDCHQECASAFGVGTPEYTDCMDKCIRALCETNQLPPEDCPD